MRRMEILYLQDLLYIYLLVKSWILLLRPKAFFRLLVGTIILMA